MEIIINILLLILLPFLFIGVINRTKSIWSGRKGPRIIQFFYDFLKLLKKGETISKTTSWIFFVSPSINLSCIIIASLLVPLVNNKSIISFDGDFILFIYMLALGRFFIVLSSMDTGSSFEAMGASREITFSTLAEPAFFIIVGSMAFLTNTISFSKFFELIDRNVDIPILVIGLWSIVLFLLILLEGSRLPFDDPNTHLELTMIHEVMVLDNSGPNLAFIQFSTALKMILFSSLITNLIIPLNLGLILATVLFILIIFIIAILIGIIESLIARVRMDHIPQIILFMSSISLITFTILLFFIKKMN